MANSSIIGKIKRKIIRDFIRDSEIVSAINNTECSEPEELINTSIFNFNQNPFTINKVGTFITIQVHIPSVISGSSVYVKPTLEIWIISHERHMYVDNVPKITENRNDYIARLIDEKINGESGFGIGKVVLESNIEGSFQMDFLYRKMVFSCIDINDSLCDLED